MNPDDAFERMVAAIPEPLYSCANESCADYYSFHADMMFFVAGRDAWYCEICLTDWEESEYILDVSHDEETGEDVAKYTYTLNLEKFLDELRM